MRAFQPTQSEDYVLIKSIHSRPPSWFKVEGELFSYLAPCRNQTLGISILDLDRIMLCCQTRRLTSGLGLTALVSIKLMCISLYDVNWVELLSNSTSARQRISKGKSRSHNIQLDEATLESAV